MKQITFDAAGGPEVLQLAEAPLPQPAAGEVLIRVAAAGINRPDVFQRMGAYPPPPGASPVLGLEVSGHIAALGAGVDRWRVGDAVCALTPGGGYAEFCVTPAAHCLPVPAGLSLIEAAALPETCFTVWGNLFQRGRLAAGESVLIHGGASGIGTTAIQLAKALGATVFVTARNAQRCAACVQLGADVAIAYESEDYVQVVREQTAGRGVDVILDMVGGDYVARNLECLAPEGRLVYIATLRGSQVQIDIRTLMAKRITLTGSTLRPQSNAAKAVIAEALREKVWPLIEAGRMRPLIDRQFALADAASAHALMQGNGHIGKIVLRVGAQ